jgi:protein dithiol oxidoreductase (disulfide-forming)
MLRIRMAVLILGVVAFSAAGVEREPSSGEDIWKPSKHYQLVDSGSMVQRRDGKIEVIEAFWYACPHCYALEPYLVTWLRERAPVYVELIRLPVGWRPSQRLYARFYYTLVALGREDLHEAVFEEIHQRGHPLATEDAEETRRLQRDFAVTHGVGAHAFDLAYDSAEVQASLLNSAKLEQILKITEVPTIVVAGKYSSNLALAGGSQKLLAMVNLLAEREHEAWIGDSRSGGRGK